jgi:hypothetical protein
MVNSDHYPATPGWLAVVGGLGSLIAGSLRFWWRLLSLANREKVMPDTMKLPQGDLRLLESDTAKRLLASTVPARFAYVAADGTPRVLPTWFYWTGEELVMPTFVAAPHIQRPAARLKALRANPNVAVTIDTESFPPNVLLIRGRVLITEVQGIVPEYRLAAHRYMGEEPAAAYLAQVEQPGTAMARIALRPAWVGVIDFETRLPDTMTGAH